MIFLQYFLSLCVPVYVGGASIQMVSLLFCFCKTTGGGNEKMEHSVFLHLYSRLGCFVFICLREQHNTPTFDVFIFIYTYYPLTHVVRLFPSLNPLSVWSLRFPSLQILKRYRQKLRFSSRLFSWTVHRFVIVLALPCALGTLLIRYHFPPFTPPLVCRDVPST
ncbi:unnamed protein product [Trypanosoma congolense IL3000]|uniref:WGS project CAEQ00000000 data, annotated contig 805 n=1 Tax=Trypanosoma congolense (strain IL3000) TaxID=1068625 RepID=F9WIK0_TRYCI|nr:unnamed protein product [Trypanosoma congolense IL3000]